MSWPKTYIAVDWGTTNRRAYRIGSDGRCSAEYEDGLGVLSLQPGDFPAAVAELRSKLGDWPMLLAGMVGSNRGWVEAAYLPCPADSASLAQQLVWVEPGRTAIVPGLSVNSAGRADVMRGEEVQLFGAVAAGLVPDTAFLCHPGTHNKWVTLSNGRVADFRTVMTGEFFNLLKERSILADLLKSPVELGPAFSQGVRKSLDGEILTAALFSVRAAVLIGGAPTDEAASLVSGLLIGADLCAGLSNSKEEAIYILGRPELTRLYASALELAGRDYVEVDGESAFIAGIHQIAEQL